MTNLQSEDWDFLGPDPDDQAAQAVRLNPDQDAQAVRLNPDQDAQAVRLNPDGRRSDRIEFIPPDHPEPDFDPGLPWPYRTGEPDQGDDFDVPGETVALADPETYEIHLTLPDIAEPIRRAYKDHTKAVQRAGTSATDEHGEKVRDADRVMGRDLDLADMRLIDEYTKDWSISQAAMRAGLGDTPKNAYFVAYHRLKKPAVKAEIDRIRAEVAERLVVDKTRVLAEYAKLAFFSLQDIFDDEGKLRPIDHIGESLSAITAMEVEELRDADGKTVGQVKKIKLADRKAALDSIAKMLGYNEPDKVKVAGLIATLPGNISTEQLEKLAAAYGPSNA